MVIRIGLCPLKMGIGVFENIKITSTDALLKISYNKQVRPISPSKDDQQKYSKIVLFSTNVYH